MFRLASRNIFRQRGRSALTLTVIVTGVLAIVLSGGFIEDIFVQLREATIHSQLGHLQIYRAGYYDRGASNPYNFLIEDFAQISSLAMALPNVESTMGRLSFSGVINNGRADVAIAGEGIEPDQEAKLGTLATIVAGRQLTNRDSFGILLGEGVANAAKLKPGDQATLLLNTADGALNSLDFDVVGIFRTFSKEYDARGVRIPLEAAQKLLDLNSVNGIVVTLSETSFTDEVAGALKGKLDAHRYEVKSWRELADFYEKTVALYRRQFAVLQGIVLLAVLLSVANSVNMNVYERTGEFGTLMALGTRRGVLLRLVLLENLLLGIIGGVAGVLLGVVFAAAISAIGIPMPPPPNSNVGYIASIRVGQVDLVAGFLIGMIATVLAALLPARRIVRLPVVEALRQN